MLLKQISVKISSFPEAPKFWPSLSLQLLLRTGWPRGKTVSDLPPDHPSAVHPASSPPLWRHWVAEHRLFSSFGERELPSSGAVQASHCGGFSCCRAWVLGCGASVVAIPGLSSTGSIVVAHRLSCSMECGIFLEPGIKPVSPALAGRFFTVEPQGKPLFYLVFNSNFYIK